MYRDMKVELKETLFVFPPWLTFVVITFSVLFTTLAAALSGQTSSEHRSGQRGCVMNENSRNPQRDSGLIISLFLAHVHFKNEFTVERGSDQFFPF